MMKPFPFLYDGTLLIDLAQFHRVPHRNPNTANVFPQPVRLYLK